MPWQESCSVTAMGGSLVRIIFIGMRIFNICTIMIVQKLPLVQNCFLKIRSKISKKKIILKATNRTNSSMHLGLFVSPLHCLSNLITNGDFDHGKLDPWDCRGASCDVSQKFLLITNRKANWGGVRQALPLSLLTAAEDLKVSLNFSLQTSESATFHWKLRITKSGETKYYQIHTVTTESQDWSDIFDYITLPTYILGAEEAEFYMEATPDEAEISLDNISLSQADEGEWIEEANQRIDRLRKKNVKVDLNVDPDVSIEELLLEVHQISHHFPFGAAVKSDRIASCFDEGEDNMYCSFIREHFNWIVDTYRMKWKPMEPVEGQLETDIPDKMIEWAHESGKTVRGHSLLWAKRHNNPGWVQTLYGEELKEAMFNRVEFAIKHFEKYNIPQWDVINEMIDQGHENHTFYMDHTGDPDIRVKVFQYAKQLSPNTSFFLNDYGIILNKNGRFPLYQQQIRDLLEAGAPIDGIGLQSHINGDDLVDVTAIKYHVDLLWEEFKLPIMITEFDWNGNNEVDMEDHTVHAEQVEKFYRLMFSHEVLFSSEDIDPS